MRWAWTCVALASIFVGCVACSGVTPRDLTLAQQRAESAALLRIAAAEPMIGVRLGILPEVVPARDLEELRAQLGELMEEIELPEEADFSDMDHLPKNPGAQANTWGEPPDRENPRPPVARYYTRHPGDEGFDRHDVVARGVATQPQCDEPFVIGVTDWWPSAACGPDEYAEKFEELKLRALAEAMEVCRGARRCHSAKPLRVAFLWWYCDTDPRAEAALKVDIVFVCTGN